MSAVTISADNPRSIRAVEIAASADHWITVSFPDGRQAYGVPSQTGSGRFYAVDESGCTCNDFKRYGQACKHILAVRLHVELLKGTKPRRRQPAAPDGLRGFAERYAAASRPAIPRGGAEPN